jgi:hypothetical protein
VKESAKRGIPLFGALSIVQLVLVAGLWLFFEKHPHVGEGLNGYAGMFIYLGLIGLTAVLMFGSIACGIVGWVRRERWRFIALLGLVLNLIAVVMLKHG